ncbi:MarR family winged helix-turn-helix transcriptional regulator [Paramicrobacterium chengjingii]|uniref:MarR family winged helix-turn-helix transcriptional regulator n=1 Tax=Paramicrobacterium chengjingii TaxID=2769067 RepID=UPI001F2D379F|nr:MarR family transcriptional regulator [Microbacterium chengjingii]
MERQQQSMSLSIVIRELAWTVHKRVPERAGVGSLPTIEVALLGMIAGSPGMSVTELSESLGLRQPNTSAALRTLVSKGLVVREVDETDRRTARIVPTQRGRDEHAAVAGAWAASVSDALGQLSESDRRALELAADAMSELTRLVRRNTELS